MIGTIILIIVMFLIVLAVKKTPIDSESSDQRSLDDLVVEGVKRTGRISLWVMLPPVGLWRSVRHGKKKHEDRLAKKIAEEMSKK